ncbi:MAG: tetratricopeptide repeat protein [Thermoguttaceae bacterium]
MGFPRQPEVAAVAEEAEQVARRVVKRFPHRAEAHDVMALAHYRFGRTAEAAKSWKTCTELNPNYTAAYYWLARCAFDKEQYEEAAANDRRACELEPNSVIYPVHLARSLMFLGKFQEAASVLQKNLTNHPELAAHPTGVPTLVLLGQAYLELRQDQRARESLEAAIGLAPDYASAYHSLFRVCQRLGDHQKAREYLEQFMVLKEQERQQQYAELKATEDLPAVKASAAMVYAAAGRVYLVFDETAEAEAHWRRAAALDPKHTQSREDLARLCLQTGRPDEALQWLAELAALEPANWTRQMELGGLAAQLGRFDQAEQAFRAVITLAPEVPVGYSSLAGLYLEMGRNLAEASTLARKAVQLEPVARNYFLLGAICHRTGDRSGALSALERAIQLDPGNPQSVQLYKQLQEQRGHAEAPVGP